MNGVEQCLPCSQHTSYGRQAAPPTNESGMARLLADDDYDERIGLHFAAALAWSRGIKIGGWHKDVVRYDSDSLHDEFGTRFRMVESSMESHETPFGTTQQFLYCYCRVE